MQLRLILHLSNVTLGTFGLPVQGHAKKAKSTQKHGPPQAPGAPWGGTLSTPRVPGQAKESGSTHRVTWEPNPFISTRNVQRKPYTPNGRGDGTPIHFTQDDHHSIQGTNS